MRFWSIITLPAATPAEKLRRLRDWAALAIAHRLPVRIRYWTAVSQIAAASTVDPNKVVPEMDTAYIMDNMPRPAVIA